MIRGAAGWLAGVAAPDALGRVAAERALLANAACPAIAIKCPALVRRICSGIPVRSSSAGNGSCNKNPRLVRILSCHMWLCWSGPAQLGSQGHALRVCRDRGVLHDDFLRPDVSPFGCNTYYMDTSCLHHVFACLLPRMQLCNDEMCAVFCCSRQVCTRRPDPANRPQCTNSRLLLRDSALGNIFSCLRGAGGQGACPPREAE